jgi:H+/Cl- antiporter ClcA
VFGVPFAGWAFALEVRTGGRLRLDAWLPALVASFVGDAVVRGLGVEHTPLPELTDVHLSVALVAKVALAGLAFGLAGRVFVAATHGLKAWCARRLPWEPLRLMTGGIAVIALMIVVGNRDYLGLSLPLMVQAVAGGAGVVAGAFALKLLFTVVTLGTGFPGGEVTPLFVIGATLGVSMARLLDVPVPVMAAVGLVAVFAGAANTPLACAVMGVELFGWDGAALFVLGCALSFAVSSHHGIYGTHRVEAAA